MTIREFTVPSGHNPVFKFNRETYSVKVDNISEHASRQDIIDLFQNFIGEVRRCEERIEVGKSRSMELVFSSRDAFMKALCMTGYTVAGVTLSVTPSAGLNPRFAGTNKQSDNRRNLYVLGLPFDLTKSEFVDVFSRYGKVSHAVILATIDNASRRRGFVVMSSHIEARLAMNALSRTEIKGHSIDVSWAVVQRSQGFLDGGDRTVAVPPTVSSPDPTEAESLPAKTATAHSSPRSKETDYLVLSTAVTPALLITNLPSLLFSQSEDLQPLLFPFGQIIELKILNAPSSDIISTCVNVAVEYSTQDSAYEAKMTLHGQVYANHMLKAEFIQSLSPLGQCDAPLQSQNPAAFSHHSHASILSPLSRSPFNFNSQQVARYDERYPPNAGETAVLHRDIATNTYPPPSLHSPYPYAHKPFDARSQSDHVASWISTGNVQTFPFRDGQCSSPFVVGSTALPAFYPARIA